MSIHLHPDSIRRQLAERLLSDAATLLTEFESTGNRADLDRAETAFQEAVKITKPNDSIRVSCLLGLAEALTKQFETKGNIEDLIHP